MELTDEIYRLAALAYDAYCKQTGGKSLATGDTLPPFANLRPAIKDAWAASAIALTADAEMNARRGKRPRPMPTSETNKPKRLLMAEQWDDFARRVVNPHAHPTQKQEMRRAFYAGGQAIFFRVIAGFAPETEPTADDLRMVEDLQQELQDFALLVKGGRA